MRDIEEIAESDLGAPDEVRNPVGQAGAGRKDLFAWIIEAVGLADRGRHLPARAQQFPIHPPGDAGAVFDAVIAGEAVQREEVRILKIDRARVLVGDIEIAQFGAGDELQARLQHLCPAENLAHKRPFDIDRRGGNAARGPAVGAAIARGSGGKAVVGMVDVSAHQRGQRHHLTEAGHPPQIPLRSGKGALGVLAVIAQQREAVELHFDITAQHRIGEPLAEIERGQGERDLALLGIDAQRLRRPASQREIGILGDPLEIDGRAQPVIAAEIVAAQEGAVAGEADRGCQAPFGRELEPAIALEIAARIALKALAAGEVGQSIAGGEIAGDLIGAEVCEVSPLRARHRRDVGEHIGP